MNIGVHLAQPEMERGSLTMASAAETEIAASWRRCRDLGLDPHGASENVILSYEQFYARRQREERHLALARPEMEFLSHQIAGHNYLIAFGDAEGIVLDVFSDVEAQDTEITKSIVKGSVWDESLRGTNALGLVAKHGKGCTVSGAEHFFASNQTITCIAAPIFRSDGGLAGILDVTSPISQREAHTASLVGLAALNISNRIFVEDHRHELIVFCHPREEYLPTQSAGLLAFDQDGRMTGATPAARSLLPNLTDMVQPTFSDIFQDGYDRALDSIHSGETALLKDRRGSGVFVRIRPTRGRLMGFRSKARPLTLGMPALNRQSRTEDACFPMAPSDDFLKQQIAIAAQAASLRLPVRICGKSGSGLSETARAIHAQIPGQDHCVEVDCSIAQDSSLEFALRGNVLDCDETAASPISGPLLETPGNVTLILDGIEALGSRAQTVTKRLLAQCDRMSREKADHGTWALVVIERSTTAPPSSQGADAMDLQEIWGHSFCVPALCERMDLQVIAETLLAEFAPAARLDADALRLMRQLGENLTFYSLRRLLFQLSRRDQNGIITAEKVTALLPQLAKASQTCPACRGHAKREANCQRIRKAVRECDGNISLAARRLGMSRNTVYKHAGAPP